MVNAPPMAPPVLVDASLREVGVRRTYGDGAPQQRVVGSALHIFPMCGVSPAPAYNEVRGWACVYASQYP
jgi:hypothetical protein